MQKRSLVFLTRPAHQVGVDALEEGIIHDRLNGRGSSSTPATIGLNLLGELVQFPWGWLMQNRRLVRDYEALPQRSRTMIHWAMTNKMSRELTGESTQTWRNELLKTDITA